MQPRDWGNDELTRFLDLANQTSYASFVNLHHRYDKLSAINDVFGEAIESLFRTSDVFPTVLLLRSHASYLAAVRLAMATQVCESYMVLRGCLEAALYGLYVAKNEDAKKKWYSRNDSEAALKEMRSEFRIGVILKYVDEECHPIGPPIRQLYEQTIDYGAHPNPRGVMGTMEIEGDGPNPDLKLNYLTNDAVQIELAMKTTAQIGIGVLKLFEAAFKTRFELLGLPEKIIRLSEGL